MSYLGLNYIGRLVSNFKDYYAGINAATLTGAIDVIIVQKEDGTFISSPFHVRFGKLGVLRSREKIVDIEINGEPVEIHMKLGESGEAFFVVEAEKDTDLPNYLVTSPLPPFENSEATLTSTSPELAPELKPTQDERTTISSTLAPPLDYISTTNMGVLRQDSLMGKRQKDLLAALKQCTLEAESHTPPAPDAPKEVKVFQATTVTEGRQAEIPFRPIVTSRADQLESNSDVDVLRRLTSGKSKQTKRRRSLKKKKGNNRRSLDGAVPFSTLAVPGEELPANEDISNSDVEQLDDEIEGIMAKPMETSQQQPLLFPEDVNPIVQITSSPGATQESNWGAVAKTMGPDFHFFSDTEVCSPEGSRPGTPVHSDSEYELGSCRDRSHALSDPGQNNQQSWRWGELPSPPAPRPSPVLTASGPPARDASTEDKEGGELSITETDSAAQKAQAQSDAQRSTLSSMFSFMRQTKKLRHDASSIPTGKAGQPVGGEIYLDDLDTDALDPELAALYFPPQHLHHIPPASQIQNPFKDEDTESGHGASLPHSPPTVNADSDSEDSQRQRHVTREVRKEFPEISLSLCGGLADMPEPPENLFLQYLVTFDDLAENPHLLESPDLVVKIGSKYYSWSAASPLVMSWFLFGRPLPSQTVDVLTDRRSGTSTSSVAEVSKKDESPRERTYSWWGWRKSQPQPKKDVEGGPGLTDEHFKSTAETEASHEHLQDVVVEAQPKELGNSNSLPSTESTEVRVSGTSSDDSDVGDASSPRKIPYARRSYYDASDKYRKTLRLSSEQIALLQLREGPNEAVFSVTTAYQGTSRCKCHIYLWRFDDKVVISDIDGTITKSDVLGHILPIVGKDWAQSGVAQLFTKIKNNGYRILYLSARAIGQASVTREYLRSVRQGGLSLPDGPLLLNPTSLLSAFHREVIEKKPEEFKIYCLRDIQALFPTDSNPYYAGYGNKVNDVWAYRAVGIPISRIFTINHKGELKHELTETFQSSYSKQSFIVDLVFPPLKASQPTSHEVSDFSQYAYWREPLPELAPTDCASLCAPYEDKLSKSRKTSRREK